jgi:hypothetical protein
VPSPIKLVAVLLLLMLGGTVVYVLYDRVFLSLFRKKQQS